MFQRHPRPHRRWADFDPPDFLFGFGRRRWGGPPRGPRFGRGDLKYVILDLLKDQPRHGYDIIRALEDRSRGFYRPSPGSVYPTLQMLEDLGYVEATQQDGKKVYAITDAGRQYLADQGDVLEDLRSRFAGVWEAGASPEAAELMHELGDLARALFHHGARGALGDRERMRRLREILRRARADIENLDRETTVL
jgi:DNA-binding PadR family transcriptional regulator